MKKLIFLLYLFLNVAIAAESGNKILDETKSYKFIIDGIPFFVPIGSEMSMNGDQTQRTSIIFTPNENWIVKNNIKDRFTGGVISIYLLNSNEANKLISERSHYKSIEVDNSEYVRKCSYLVVENITSLSIYTINNVVTYTGQTVLLEEMFDLSKHCGISKLE